MVNERKRIMIGNETESSLSAQFCKCILLTVFRGEVKGLNQNLRKQIGMCPSVGRRQLQVQCQPPSERCRRNCKCSKNRDAYRINTMLIVFNQHIYHLRFMVLLFVIKIDFPTAFKPGEMDSAHRNRALESWWNGEVIAYCRNVVVRLLVT